MSLSAANPAVTHAKMPEEIPTADVKCSTPFVLPAERRAKCHSSPEKVARYSAAIALQIATAEDKFKKSKILVRPSGRTFFI